MATADSLIAAGIPLGFLQAYPFPAFVVVTTPNPQSRPPLRSRDTVRQNNKDNLVSPFSESIPQLNHGDSGPLLNNPARITWANPAWRQLKQGLLMDDLADRRDFREWLDGSVEEDIFILDIQDGRSAKQMQLSKTTYLPGTTGSLSAAGQGRQSSSSSSLWDAPVDTVHAILSQPCYSLSTSTSDYNHRPRDTSFSGGSETPTPHSVYPPAVNMHRTSNATDSSSASARPSPLENVSANGSYFTGKSGSKSASSRATKGRSGRPQSSISHLEQIDERMRTNMTDCWSLLESFDWTNTPLGPRSGWSDVLEPIINMVFASPSSDSVWLGKDMNLIYNASYSKLLSHPQAFGKPARETWSSIWDYLEPIAAVCWNGESTYRENDLLLYPTIGFKGTMEHYHTWRYVPIKVKGQGIIGLFNQSIETTSTVIAERRMETVRDLSEQLITIGTTREYFDTIAETLEKNAKDAPFFLCYNVHLEKTTGTDQAVDVRLERTVGVPEDHPSGTKYRRLHIPAKSRTGFGALGAGLSSPTLSAISSAATSSDGSRLYAVHEGTEWPIRKALATRQCVLVPDVSRIIDGYTPRQWDELPRSAIVVPICSDSSLDVPESIIIVGLNPHRPFDADYDGWIHVIRSQLATSYQSVRAKEEEQKRAADQARMDRAKNSWFRGAAYDLKNPLTLVVGPLEDLLESQDLSVKQRAGLTVAKRNTDRLMRLVNALMEFSRLEAGKIEGRFVPTDIGRFVADLCDLFRPSIEKLGLEFIVDIQPYDKLVWIDPTLFETVVSNLIGNAIKYTEHGSITVTVKCQGHAEVSVRDTGRGIPEEELEVSLEWFHRSANLVHRGTQGSGLGLAIAREILDLHDGELRIQSSTIATNPDQHGSTFTACIPLGAREGDINVEAVPFGTYGTEVAREAARWIRDGGDTDIDSEISSEKDAESAVGSKSSTGTGLMFEKTDVLLLVDESADLRHYIRRIFSPYCQVIEAVDGEEALRLAIDTPPNLILTDLMMQGMSGLQLLEAIRAHPITNIIPVVILSADVGDEAKSEALFMGSEDYLIKPFKPKELLARVHLHMQVGKKRAKLEALFAVREAELKVLADYCPSGILRTDPEATILYANHAWREMSDIGPDGDPQDWPNFVEPQVSFDLLRDWGEWMQSGEKEAKMTWSWKNGRTVAALFVNLALVRPGMTGVLGCLTDITPEIERIADAEKRRLEAEESRYQQELLVDLTSHEIRTPVSAILQCSSLVKENMVRFMEQLRWAGDAGFHPTPEFLEDLKEDVEALEGIYQCGLVQERIAGDVLSLARIQLDMLSLHAVDSDIRREAQKVFSVFLSEAKMKKIQLSLTFGKSLEQAGIRNMKTDHVRLGQVVTNLLSNAMRFTAASSVREITLHYEIAFVPPTHADAEELDETCALPRYTAIPAEVPVSEDLPMWLYVSVSDSGPGLSESEQKMLFKRFSQSNMTIHTRFGGSGLGLFICKKITELLGGKIEVVSTLGQGSCFRFFIQTRTGSPPSSLAAYVSATASGSTTPLSPSSAMSTSSSIASVLSSAAPAKDTVADLKGLRILIVEDNEINQNVLRRQIMKAGLTCDVANNGLEALNLISEANRAARRTGPNRKPPYAVILMDLEMPVMNGLTAIREIRNSEATGALDRQMVVALTGNARQGQIDQAMQAGMDDVVIKPYVLSNLLKKIREMTAKRANMEAQEAEWS